MSPLHAEEQTIALKLVSPGRAISGSWWIVMTPEPPADLGQKEAELEKTGKEQMGHMEGGDASKTAQQPAKRGTK